MQMLSLLDIWAFGCERTWLQSEQKVWENLQCSLRNPTCSPSLWNHEIPRSTQTDVAVLTPLTLTTLATRGLKTDLPLYLESVQK